jgi:phage terminase large subunit-like protein
MARRKRPQPADPNEPGLSGTDVQIELDNRLLKLGWYFDVEEADRVCFFFEKLLRHSKGEWAGKNFVLEPWQRAFLRRLFGWRRPDGTRRYRRAALWIPRKNGKSTIAAGVALYLLIADGEPGAEIYSAAADKEQAALVFVEATRMAEASPVLSELTEVFRNSLFVPTTLSKYQPLTSKSRTKHGLNVHGVVIDEVHALVDRSLYDVLTTASGSRRQPLEFLASTSGDNIASFAYEQFDLAEKVIAGTLEDPEFLPVVYAASKKDDWEDPATWAKANPNFGISIKPDYFKSELAKIRGTPGRLASFLQLHLNIWAQSSQAWLSIDHWKACPKTKPLEAYRGRPAFGGLDLSSTTDTTAFVIVIPMEDGRYDVLVWIFIPEENAEERAKRDRVQYPLWIKQGHVIATEGNSVDYSVVRAKIMEVAAIVDLQELAYDPWNATETTRILSNNGIRVQETRQGFRTMSPPSKLWEQLVRTKKVAHQHNPAFDWMVSNVVVRTDDNENIQPTKRLSRDRIDAVVATLMGLERARLSRDQESVYETRGPLVI